MTETQRHTQTEPPTQPEAPTQIQARSNRAARRRLLRAATLVVAAAIAVAIWAISVPVFGLDLTVGAGASVMTVDIASVIVAPLVAGGAAWGLLAILERVTRRARRSWTIIGCVVLALSLLGPLSIGVAGGVLVSLLAMHLAVGATLILGLRGSAADQNRVH